MKVFTTQDIADYYDHTEVHYRMFWRFEETLGMHYAIWDEQARTLTDAILNTNAYLASLTPITPGHHILDAGCGVGGSAIYLAQHFGCRVTGVTVSERQVTTCKKYAAERGVGHLTEFHTMDYNFTNFPDNTFDIIWGIESVQTTLDKSKFFKEARRILKPGGKILISDYFKPKPYSIDDAFFMRTMLQYWAISDVTTLEEFCSLGTAEGFSLKHETDVNKKIFRSVLWLFLLAFPGTWGTWFYNWFVHKARYFARNHYKTYYAQFIAYVQGKWRYKHILMELDK